MLDKVILGLLAFQGQSLYDLKKIMEESTSLFFSASTGSLHPALKKLENGGLINVEERLQGERVKKIYSRTQAGSDAFQAWITEPVANMKVKDEGLLRLYFFGQIEGDVAPFIQRYINEADQWIETLSTLYDYVKTIEVEPDYQKVYFFEMATLKYGLDSLKFAKQWYVDLLDEYRQAGLS
ncbi:PadR family transcriptional regulator [Thaumasiovibrio subtropicus]|uniref:PadR family transcriptional regulator n=1 Tax=Thaumasiovibrio subtropicus TaxID=1891207 RepID=UPI000B34B61B|nr:PadR family transcriptional regulator [Thaumasiovibrio subtropicus]